MLLSFFYALRQVGLPVTLREYLVLLEGLRAGVEGMSIEGFYRFARCTLVKDERYFDRFDRVFARCFGELATPLDLPEGEIPEEWLKSMGERYFSEEEKRAIEAMGGFDELMKTLKERFEEQEGRHEGGSKWIGTRGRSPFGSDGYNPEGVRVGGKGRHQRAVKVWEERRFRNLDDHVALGTRNFQMALRRLRRFVREGPLDELDIDASIESTAANAGLLELEMRAARKNRVKVLMLLDVGGSMSPYVEICERLFSAARSELKNLEFFYFHNCIYETVWKDNRRRRRERMKTQDLIRTYGRDYKLIFVGDASMSPYEIVQPGGSVEHWNEESGEAWLQRVLGHFERAVWLNPVAAERWEWTHSIAMISELIGERMYELSIEGVDQALVQLR